MKLPISWLKEYVDLDATVEDIADKLTFSGVEVEGIESVGLGYEHVVVAEVLAIERHPRADRLSVCRVSDGSEELQVVCGADNFAVGDKVPLAGIGAELVGGFKVKKAKLRGVESFGMLCAEDELGLSDDHSGLMILPSDLAAGTPFSEVAGPPDTVLALEITWNRPDCLCVIGIARELAALYGVPLRLPSVDYEEVGEDAGTYAQVRIEDEVACPRYTARVLTGAKLGPSPLWMQRRLSLCGVRPINNIVDVTNYVLLECGQPLHAFDYTLLKDGQIVVRRAAEGETMSTLDAVERTITPEMLVIADADRPVALAGVMGGAGSEIVDTTETVLLESAAFDAALIHSTSVALGLSTESSHRFERGVDIDHVDWASRRAAQLMVELAGATAAKGVVDLYPGRKEPKRIACRYAHTRERIGVEIPDERIRAIFDSLELRVVDGEGEACTIEVPSFRLDLEREADLIEEVARINGLESIPEALPTARIVADADDSRTRARYRCRAELIGLGLTEAMHYSFLSESLLDVFGRDQAARRVVLPHPVSSDHAIMRDSLIPQMVETLGRNLSRQVQDAALFEIGKVFRKGEGGKLGEAEHLCIGLMGKVGRSGIDSRLPVSEEEMFLWMKGMAERFLRARRISGHELKGAARPYYETGTCVELVVDGSVVGEMGLLGANIREKWRMHGPIAVAEFSLNSFMENDLSSVSLSPVPAYPAVSRDIAMVLDESVRHADILHVIRESAPAELTRVALFDIYRDKRMGYARKSVAYSLEYRSLERTLTDEEANEFHGKIKDALRDKLKADIREE